LRRISRGRRQGNKFLRRKNNRSQSRVSIRRFMSLIIQGDWLLNLSLHKNVLRTLSSQLYEDFSRTSSYRSKASSKS
jgi:hypothetical protein